VLLGLTVRDLDRTLVRRLDLRLELRGMYVSGVDPLSNAALAGFAEGDLILEVNRRPVTTMREYLRAMAGQSDGDIVVFLCYVPDLDQRVLRTVRIESGRS
jgi:serine protease Do